MKTLQLLCVTFVTWLGFSGGVFAVELPNYPNNSGRYLYKHVSPDVKINIVDAYISYKYVGGYHVVVTFSVPDEAYAKEVYLVTDPYRGTTVAGVFVDTMDELYKGNIVWLESKDGRAYFVMVANTYNGFTYRQEGDFDLYVKMAGKQYMGRFWLR